MNCSRCRTDNPPENLYCGHCGGSLEEPPRRQANVEFVGWLMMASGLIILALTALYYVLSTTILLWSVGWELLDPFYELFYNISGDGVRWPNLTIGVLLGTLGATIYAWPRIRVAGPSGKGIKALMLIGGALLTIGAVFGSFPWEIARSYVANNALVAMGIFSHNYQALVLSGLACILAAAVWAAWRSRSWKLPSTATSDRAAEGKEADQ